MAKKLDDQHAPTVDVHCPICGRDDCHIYRITRTRKLTKTEAKLYMRGYHPFKCRNEYCLKWCANERGYCWSCDRTTPPFKG